MKPEHWIALAGILITAFVTVMIAVIDTDTSEIEDLQETIDDLAEEIEDSEEEPEEEEIFDIKDLPPRLEPRPPPPRDFK